MIVTFLMVTWGLPGVLNTSVAHANPTPDADISAITGGMQSFCDLTKGLASDGALGQVLPLLNLIPGGDSGFGFSDACQTSLMSQVTSALNNVSTPLLHCSQLASMLTNGALGLSNTRSATLTVSNVVCGQATSGSVTGVPDQVPLDLTLDRTVSTAGLNIKGSGNQGPLSISSTNGVTVGLHLDLAVTFAYDFDKNFFYLVDNSTTKPTLSATATISIPNGTQINAGIGILKATLTGSLNGSISLSATMSDPSGSGQLGFTLGTGGAGNTALASAQLGSIFNVAAGGSLTGSMSLAPDGIGTTSFPAATFQISWTDVTNPSTLSFSNMTNFSGVLDNFQNMTPRDLADGLGHTVQMIRGIEAANNGVNLNVNLPFMKGSLSDATKIEESLADFLSKHVTTSAPTTQPQGTSSNTTYELPDFSSVQDLVTELTNYSPSTGPAVGSLLNATGVSYDQTNNKLSLTLSLGRSSANSTNLDGGAKVGDSDSTASNVTYGTATPPTLKDSSKTWTTNQWAGFEVITSDNLHSNTVVSNTSNTLTLQSAWLGGTPSNVGYTLETQDPKTGLVDLGNLSSSSSGTGKNFLVNANATVPQATISPTYSAGLTLVLDLEPAVTGDACKTFYYNPVENPSNQACPFVPSAGGTVVNSLPTAPDRIMIRTADGSGTGLPLFTFDAPIATQVSIDAQAGFLGVHLDGTLKECTTETGTADCSGTADSGKHLINVNLKPQADSAHQYDIPVSQVFSDLTSGPSSLLQASINGQAYATINVSVPDAGQFFGNSGTAGLTITMADITNPTNVSVDTSQLSKLLDFNFDPSNPQALFGALVKGLQVLLQTLQNTPGAASGNSPLNTALSTNIPGINRSLKDILASSEGGTGNDVTYGTSMGVGTITDRAPGGADCSVKNWTIDQFKGRAVAVGTSLMTIAGNTCDTLTLTAGWGTQPADGAPYVINNELEAALSQLTSNPGNSLQSVVDVLNKLLGTNAVKFTVNNSNSTDGPMLEMDIDWNRSYSTEAPIGFDLSKVSGIPSQLTSIVGIQAQGVTKLDASAELKLGLLLPLSTDTSNACYLPTTLDPSSLLNTLCITSDSKITAGVTGSVNGSVQVNVGPVAVALGNPSDTTNNGAEAKATLSVGLGDSTSPAGTVESIGSFLGNVSPSFNDGTAVTCNDPNNTSSDPLAVCAVLPLYVKNGSTWNPVCTGSGCTADELFLRLPQTSDPTSTFDLNGANLTGGVPRFGTSPALSQIGTDLASQILDLNALNGGIDGYFQFAENALNLASDNGKLPLVGQDLQEGSAFLTNLQATFDSVMGSLGSANNVKAVEDFGNTKLQNALNSAGVLPSGSSVTGAVTCTSSGQLSSPQPTATATNPDSGTTNYQYEIVASTSDGNAPAGTASATIQNVDPSKLGSTDFNALTWTAASNVTYAVFRSVDSGAYYQVASGLTSGSFTDNVTSTTGAAVPTGGSPCDPNASITAINGVTFEVSIGQGTVTSANGCTDATGSPCITGGVGGNGVPFNIGVPGLSFSAAGSSSQNLLSVKVGWGLHLKFGIDTTNGFFVCTGEINSSTTPCGTSTGFAPLGVGLAFTLPPQMKLNIAFLQMCVANHPVSTGTDPCTDTTAPSTPAFAGAFTVNLNSPHSNGMITGADLAGADLSSLVTPKLSAAVNLDWDFLVDTSAGAALPGLGGEFKLSWAWSSASPDSGAPTIQFLGVYIDAGSFLSGVFGKILDEVNQILNPIRPVIDVLEAPIPVLSQLSEAIGGPPVTLLSIAQAFSTLAGGPDLTAITEVVQVVKFVADLSAQVSALSGKNIHIPLGSFNVSGPAAKDTTATPDNANQLIDTSSLKSCDPNPLPGTGGTAPGCTSDANSTFGQLNSNAGSLTSDNSVTDSTSGQNNQKYGFQFTALQHPASLLSVLMGKDVELFAFDTGPLTLGFSYTQQFGPVYAPPPVLVVISGSASISARIRVGFDTKGIREAIDAANSGGGAGGVISGILDGLYISTTDPNTGQPIPAITLTGTLAAGAEVSVFFLSVGIEGGITLTINLLWNDPDNDGKLRFSEFLAGLSNPLCLFNFSGSLSAFIKLFIDIGFSPFDISFSFDLVNITLLDFSTNNSCAASPDPPILGKVQAGVLYVYAGKLGTGEFRDVSSKDHWGNDEQYTGDEKFLVTELHDSSHAFSGMAISWQGHRQEFDDTSIKTVYIDAQNYGGKESFSLVGDSNTASQDAPFDRAAIVIGGNKDDAIQIDDGCPNAKACTDPVGNVYVDGGAGDDQINVGDANAIVAGGPGANQIQVGNGDDWVDGNGGDIGTAFGNSALTFSTTSYGSKTIIDPSKAIGHITTWSQSSGDGNDNIHVGLGGDTVWGGGGNNTISVAKDSPLSTLPNTNSRYCNTPGMCVSKGDTIIGGGGSNHISGSSGDDTIWAGQYGDPGLDPADNWRGVSGDGYDTVTIGDAVNGGGTIVRTGNTTVYGGSGGNFVQGNSIPGKTDTIYGGSGDDTLLGGNGNDKIYGEAGNNVIIGGTGSSLLVGGTGDDYIVAGGGDVEPRTGAGGNAVNASGQPFYGAPGPVHLDSNGIPIRTATLPTPGSTNDGHNTIIGGGGSNHIWGGNGGDTIYGHYQDETCAAPAPGDHPYAVQYDVTKEHAGESTLFDWIYGGSGDDTISGGGGTNYIDSGQGNDLACGGSGNDTIIGHSTPTQVDKFYGISGRNFIYGGNGDDQLFGGNDNDTIYAGSGNSYIEGGDGANTIYAGGGNDVIIGGTSAAASHHNPDSLSPAGPTGGRLFGGTGVAVIVGDNGCADMTAQGPAVSFPGQPITISSCFPSLYGSANPADKSPNLHVYDLDSANPSYGENNYMVGGQGPSMLFGGLGSNTIIGGANDNYIEGGTGPNYIQGGGGNNDIMGGSSPSYLPLGTCTGGSNQPVTGCIPAGSNIIYGDDGTGGTACACEDGSNAIIADNGQITRAGVYPGWQAAALTSNLITWGDGSIVPNRTITSFDIYNGDLQGAASWLFAGTRHDFLFGGPGGDHIYGGPPLAKQPIGTAGASLCPAAPAPCIDANAPYGNDYMEGGPGHTFLESAGGQNDMIGGVSPFHLASGKTTTDVPNSGSTIYGGNGDNYLVADNGEIDHQCGTPGNPTAVACTTPSTPWTSNPNDGSFFRQVTLWDLPVLGGAAGVGGDSELHTGNGYSQAYGGKGNNKVLGGLHDDFLMGGTGNNCISGSGGSNDIVGGTVPEVLPAGLKTSSIPSGSNIIYADMVDASNNSCLSGLPGGSSAGPADGSNVVIGNNGDITRQHDGSGYWIKSNNDPNDLGIIQRNVTNLDIYTYPLAAEPGVADVIGGSDVIFGGTHDDILLGGPAGNHIYAGPPSATVTSTHDPVTNNYFDNTQNYGNNHIEGGPGVNAVFGAGGDDDIIGSVSPLYLAASHDTGTVGSLDTSPAAHPGNLLVGGTGNDYIAGANAQIDHLCGPDLHVCAPVDPAQWAYNANDHGRVAGPLGATIRQIRLLNLTTASGPTGTITHGVGSDNKIFGTAGDNHLYGENGDNSIQGGWGNDYIEGGTGNNLIQGGGGDKDIVGGTSPASIASQGSVASTDAYVANRLPSGNNIICSFECGQKMPVGSMTNPLVNGDLSNDSVIVGHNGRIDRCTAAQVGGVWTPQGSDRCGLWQTTPYGNEKVSSYFNTPGATGVAQTGQICTAVGPGCLTTGLGNPRTRFTTLIGQSSTETIQAGTDYIEGNIGNNTMYGEDGPAVIHGYTPNQTDPGRVPDASSLFPQYSEFGASFTLSDECLPNSAYSTVHNQNIIIGGYGGAGVGRNLHDLQNGFGSNDVLCGGYGDDAILGNRGTVGTQHAYSAGDPLSGAVTPVPFSNGAGGPVTIGTTGGPPYGTLTLPSSGNTIYPTRLDMEYSDGALIPVPNWNNPSATGQLNQHDIIFGGGGNNTIHGSPGADFIEGESGMHVTGTPAPCAAVPPSNPAPSPCTPTGDNIIYGGQGNTSAEGGPGNSDIFGGTGNKDLDVKRSDTTTAPKVDDNGNCMPLAFPTINVTPGSLGVSNGYCAANPSFPQYQWANQSYASRFPLPTGQSYDGDFAGRDNGGTSSHTPVFGHVVISGMHRDIDQSQGFGDRMIGPNGSYNLFYTCPAAYGGYQIIRAFKPSLLAFMQQLASADGGYNVNQSSKAPSTMSSGDYEVNFVYSGSGNNGSAYPTTTGHFTC